jgi:RNA recognition motif-containing protein
MTNRVYVGSLPYATTGGKLEEIFAQYGTVQSARVITDKLTGRSKGLALSKWARALRRKTRFKP